MNRITTNMTLQCLFCSFRCATLIITLSHKLSFFGEFSTQPNSTKIGVRLEVADVINHTKFYNDRSREYKVTDGRILACSIGMACRHNTVARLCYTWLSSVQCVSSIGQIIKSVCVSVSESVSQWVSLSVNFRTPPPISRERLKLESLNLAHILATGGPNEKMQNEVKMGRERVTWPTFRILGPPPYLGNGWS